MCSSIVTDKFPDLIYASQVNGRCVLPMPRVASTAICHTLKKDAGYSLIKPSDRVGPVATFVRNPYDRLVSAYTLNAHNVDFCDFVWQIIEYNSKDIHHLPQCEILPDPDFIGRYEYLARDFAAMCDWLEIDRIALRHVNKSSKRMPTELYYSPSVRDMAAEFYAKDFEAYGYSTALEARRPEASSVKRSGYKDSRRAVSG